MTKTGRTTAAAVLLIAATALALLGVLVHHGFTAEYGHVADSPLQGLARGLTAGLSGAALGLVVVVAGFALVLSSAPWMRVTALAIPVLMLLGMLAVTPVALQQKIEAQYDPVPQCVSEDSQGPAATAERESQRAFDSIEHVGHFGGGGASGVGGCDRTLVVSEEVDVLQHYRAALPAAGWEVIADDGRHLRAHRENMAFELRLCPGAAVVWAGDDDDSGVQCGQQ